MTQELLSGKPNWELKKGIAGDISTVTGLQIRSNPLVILQQTRNFKKARFVFENFRQPYRYLLR